MNRSSIVSVTGLILSAILLIMNFYRMETLTITSCAICVILFSVSSYRSVTRGEHLRIGIMVIVLIALMIGTLSPFLGTTDAIAAFLETLPYVFVAIFIIAEMIAFMGMRLDKALFTTFSLMFSMAIASFAAVVTYLIRIEDIRSEIIVNNDIVVQFAASFVISIVVIILSRRMMKKRDIRIITKETLLEGNL